MVILFVCQGNVGRSQMAEAFYNHLTKTKDAASAGISQTTPKRYMKLPDGLIGVMKEVGIDMSQNKVKTVTEEMVNQAETIFVMAKKEACPEFLVNSKKAVFWDVQDPYNLGLDKGRDIRDLIKSKVGGIV